MKIAVLFWGQPRFWKESLPLIKKNLLQDNEVTYFVHTWSNITQRKSNYGNVKWYDVDIRLNSEKLGKDLKEVFGEHVRVSDNEQVPVLYPKDCGWITAQSYSFTLSGVVEMFNQYCDQNVNEVFDLVVMMRMDALYLTKLDWNELVKIDWENTIAIPGGLVKANWLKDYSHINNLPWCNDMLMVGKPGVIKCFADFWHFTYTEKNKWVFNERYLIKFIEKHSWWIERLPDTIFIPRIGMKHKNINSVGVGAFETSMLCETETMVDILRCLGYEVKLCITPFEKSSFDFYTTETDIWTVLNQIFDKKVNNLI